MRDKPSQITERVVGDVTVLDLKGRLVVGDGDEAFRDILNRLIQLGRRKILLNLDEVTYIDSGGLGMMIAKYISLCKRDGHMKLCHVRDRPLKVLNITKLLTVFEYFESEAEALKSFE
jgi:anti-sigma B factor antagonist